jgi:L,D-peptidoglycan transpeptidase YkuD (ErfK/YbiS/YcfS/YnhG family)
MIILATAEAGHLGFFEAFNNKFVCALGAGGVAKQKREGDLKSPAGRFALREVLYRADRLDRPATGLPARSIGPDDGWCDEPNDSAYNRPVKLPYRASAENLWRADNIYDLVVVIGYNDDPVVRCLGSAIFLHVATEKYGPTRGCVALAYDDLLPIVCRLDANAEILIRCPASG